MGKVWAVGFGAAAAVLVAVLIAYRGGMFSEGPLPEEPAELFRQACGLCHGAGGEGRRNYSPPLRGRNLSPEAIMRIVAGGRGRMPAQPHIRGEALEKLARYVAGMR